MAEAREITEEEVRRIKQYLMREYGRDEILFLCAVPDEMIEEYNHCMPPKGTWANPLNIILFPVCISVFQCVRFYLKDKLPHTVYVVTHTHVFQFLVTENRVRVQIECPIWRIEKVSILEKRGGCCPRLTPILVLQTDIIRVSSSGSGTDRRTHMSKVIYYMTPADTDTMRAKVRGVLYPVDGGATVVAPPPYEQPSDMEKKRVFVALAGTEEFKVFHIVGQDWSGFLAEINVAFGKQPTALKLADLGAVVSNAGDVSANDKLLME